MSTRHPSTKKLTKQPKKGKSTQGISYTAKMLRSPAEIVPSEVRVTLPYVDQFVLNATSASTDNHVYRGNSLFDPDFTGTGHQPLGYDQWTTFYSAWVVEQVRVKATITAPDSVVVATSNNNAIFAISPRRNDNSTFTSVLTACEQPYTEWCLVGGFQKPAVLTMTLDVAKFLGVSPLVLRNVIDYSGSIGANPLIITFLDFYCASPLAGTVDPAPANVTVEFEFVAKFYNAITLAAS